MRAARLTITVIVLTILVGYIVFAERIESDGFVLNVGGRIYDPVGAIDNFSNKVVRDCSGVIHIPTDSNEAGSVKTYLYNSLHSGEPQLNQLIELESWLIAEATFESSEPGIFLLQKVEHGYITHRIWGGTAAPFKTAPVFRDYFLDNTPEAPLSLIRCYEPLSPPLNW